MTDREETMYHILSCLSESNAPLIFKGGLITNLVLQENGYETIRRATVDIDANWATHSPSMDELVNTVKKALGKLEQQYVIEPFREYGENRSAGLNFYDKEHRKIFSMDIEIKPILESRLYYYGKASFQGILPTKIIADKICSVSSDLVYKHRTKDLVDLYALVNCLNIKACSHKP